MPSPQKDANGSISICLVSTISQMTSWQIVPIGSAYRSSKLIPDATLKEYPGAPHALISTSKDEINKDLLAFIKK